MGTRRSGILGLALVILALAIVGRLAYRVYFPPRESLAMPEDVISIETDEGRQMLARSLSADQPALASNFVPQIHGSFCGIASATVSLRALGFGPVTQETFFDERTDPIQTWAEVFFGGITLDELGRLLEAKGATVAVTHAEANGTARFREVVRRNAANAEDALIVNYDRRVVGESGGGHISPIAAYDARTDRVLLLDTASYKYPPHWIRVDALVRAMATVDESTGTTRGYVEVTRRRR